MSTYSVFRVDCLAHEPGQACHWAECKSTYLSTFESRREAIAHARATNRPAWVFRDNLRTGLGTLVASVNEVYIAREAEGGKR